MAFFTDIRNKFLSVPALCKIENLTRPRHLSRVTLKELPAVEVFSSIINSTNLVNDGGRNEAMTMTDFQLSLNQ